MSCLPKRRRSVVICSPKTPATIQCSRQVVISANRQCARELAIFPDSGSPHMQHSYMSDPLGFRQLDPLGGALLGPLPTFEVRGSLMEHLRRFPRPEQGRVVWHWDCLQPHENCDVLVSSGQFLPLEIPKVGVILGIEFATPTALSDRGDL